MQRWSGLLPPRVGVCFMWRECEKKNEVVVEEVGEGEGEHGPTSISLMSIFQGSGPVFVAPKLTTSIT